MLKLLIVLREVLDTSIIFCIVNTFQNETLFFGLIRKKVAVA